ncbi:TATA-binding protein-associated factor 2N-like [Lineus longissimus]|uniref:TATA-binding protein-associated factor 2N-like n=1 Tax=Lineus longissimus TaxID=88925 RepID=UPI002B4D8624
MDRTKAIKQGYIRKYVKSVFSSGWKKQFLVLHQDGELVWYSDQGDRKANGAIKLKAVCNFMAIGPFTQAIPKRPSLPSGGQVKHLLAIPQTAARDPKQLHWFIFLDDTELAGWMNTIMKVLPPPPAPPQNFQRPPGGPPQQSSYPKQQGGYPRQQQVGYPQQQCRGQPGGGNTTVVMGSGGRSRGGGDRLATGMLVGAGLSGWGWGWGWGWGGPGWYSGHYGYGGMGEHDHYEINETNIENTNINETNITENNEFSGDASGAGYGGYDPNNYQQTVDQGGLSHADQGGYVQGGYADQGGFVQGGYGDQGGYVDQGGLGGGYDGGDFGGGDFGGDCGGGDDGGGDDGGD